MKLYRFVIITLLLASPFNRLFSQKQVSSADNDFYLFDTLLLDPSQMEILPTLDLKIQKTLTFKPKTDGFKTYFFINGNKCCKGLLKNKQKDSIWTTWYDSSQVANKINYINGIQEGACEYWYKNGQLNANGQYKNDLKEGEWLFYNRDGTFKGKFIYLKGKVIGQE